MQPFREPSALTRITHTSGRDKQLREPWKAFFFRSFGFLVHGRFLVGGAGPNAFLGGFAGYCLDGGGGNDILHGRRGNDLLIGVDVIFGGSGDDTVVADTEDLLLSGGRDGNGAVADTNNGNTLDLSDVAEGIFVDLDINLAGAPNPGLSQEGAVRGIGVVSGGPETFNIRAVDFENVIGTEFADRLFGNAEANVLEGRGGDDVFHAFAGNDIYDGGEGVDTALFVQAAVGIVVDLAAGTVETGPDLNTLIDIENLTGSVFGDVILGDVEVNALSGNGGSDVLNGREGGDVLTGGGAATAFSSMPAASMAVFRARSPISRRARAATPSISMPQPSASRLIRSPSMPSTQPRLWLVRPPDRARRRRWRRPPQHR
ncbi:MAG: calcium-binding protein [Pseudomonadota bacterium]